jgi:hypothetical protein
MDEPIKFTPAPLTENELLLLADDQPSLRAVAVAVGAAADAEGMELPESARGAVSRGALVHQGAATKWWGLPIKQGFISSYNRTLVYLHVAMDAP